MNDINTDDITQGVKKQTDNLVGVVNSHLDEVVGLTLTAMAKLKWSASDEDVATLVGFIYARGYDRAKKEYGTTH